MNGTEYAVSSNLVTLPNYPTALKCPTALTINFNGATQLSYDGSAAKTLNITPAAIGAAASSHSHTFASITNKPTTLAGYGITDAAASSHNHDSVYAKLGHNHDDTYAKNGHTHSSYASKVKVNGTEYAVSSNLVTLPNYPTALKCPTALTINFNGSTQLTYDGSATKTLNITPAAIGAAASSHTHSQYATGIDIGDGAGRPTSGGMLTIPAYVPKSGGTFTGDVNVPYLTSDDGIESGGNVQATGFKVEGSSDANIVLAGGGTKAVSYFATAGHTHSYLPLSGGTLTGNLTCNKDLYSNYLKPTDGQSDIYIGDSANAAYVTFVEDMRGYESNWIITIDGSATFNDITTSTMKVNTSLEAEKIFTNNIKTSASGLKVQKSDYVTSYAQIGPSGQIELYAGTPFIDFHYNNSTSDYSTRIVCDTSSRLSVLATTLRASNAITCVSLTQTSDERLKDNIKDIDGEFINKIFDTDNGFIHQFDFKESGKHSNGIIAQEVKDIMPEVVDYDETDDVYRVDYTSASMKLIGAMFKKMKQMQEEIDKLKEMNSNK